MIRKVHISHILSWAKKYERILSTLLFVGGFITDIVTFAYLDLPEVNYLFIGYIAVVVITVLIHHLYTARDLKSEGNESVFATVVLPLITQFFLGSLLSGFLIFYTKSATLIISWPFILFLVLIYLGNEIFRNLRSHITFQLVLLYFALFSYSIFAVPLYIGKIGAREFILSTLLTVVVFVLYMLLLAGFGWKRFKSDFLKTILSCIGITAVIGIAYASNLIPPLPLAIREAGIYQNVSKDQDTYTLTGEPRPGWFGQFSRKVHAAPGGSLVAYTAIFAPGSFTADITHEWSYLNPETKVWEQKALITFTLHGGREAGYRGYTVKHDIVPGTWRVTVKTSSGQILGSLPLTVLSGAASTLVTI